MRTPLLFVRAAAAPCLLFALLACSDDSSKAGNNTEEGGTGGSKEDPSSAAGSTSDAMPHLPNLPGSDEPKPMPGVERECKASGAVMKLTGTACGAAVSYSGPADVTISMMRASLSDELGRVSVIQAADSDLRQAVVLPSFLDTHDSYLHLKFAEPFKPEEGEKNLILETGVLLGCGFGSVSFAQNQPLTVTIESLDAAADTARVVINDIVVEGFSESFPELEVDACDGSVSLVLDGPFRTGY